MKASLSFILLIFFTIESCSLKLNIDKRAVFDLIPGHNRVDQAQHTDQDIENKLNLQNTLTSLWNQYNGNWLARNGKITLMNRYFQI